MIQACPPKMSNRTKNFCIELKYLSGLGLSSRCGSSSTAILNFFFFFSLLGESERSCSLALPLLFISLDRRVMSNRQTDSRS